MSWLRKDNKGKSITFKWFEEDDAVSLGVPEDVVTEKGNWRDGGCQLKFSTSEASIGLEERFALYLFAEDVNKITLEIWTAYFSTEPQRAQKDFQEIFHKLQLLAKQK